MSLLALQRDFRSWLTTESSDAGGRLEGGDAPGLAVYLNNYRGSLMACLAESYETTRAWLGEEAFAAAAADHIDRLPPHSWTLDAYALGLPDTLDRLYPDDAEVGDLARLECALGTAFVGRDAERLDPASLANVDWDEAALGFVPTLVLLGITSNAGAIWSAIAAGEQPPPGEMLPEPAYVAIWRDALTPAFRTLDTGEADALKSMMASHGFDALCTDLVQRHGEEQGPAMAGALLAQWLQDGIVSAILSPASAE
jgi:hypothetical protein